MLKPLTGARRLFFEKDVMRLMGLTVMVKLLGLATQVLIASYFGAGPRYDAYAFALFLGTFLEGSVGRVYTGVLVPATIRLRQRLSHRDLMSYQNAAVLLFLGPGLAATILMVVRPGLVVDLIGPNLPAETRGYVVRMLPWMALGGLGFLGATMGKAILNLNRRFGLAGAMPVLQAGVMLGAVLGLNRPLGVWSLPVGFLAGNLLQVAVLTAGSTRSGLMAAVRPHFPPGALRQIFGLGWMFMVAQVMLTLQQSLDKLFATGLPPGSISSISYSLSIINMGVQLFTLSLVVVMFTRLSEFLAGGRNDRAGSYFRANLERVCRIVVPVSVGLSLASGEVVRVLFMRGAFDAADAARTSSVLSLYLLGLPALIFNPMMGRIFHSLQRMRDKMLLTGQYLLTQVGGNLLLVGPLGVRGLAISSAFAINLHVLLVLWVLHRYRLGMGVGGFAATIARSYALGGASFLLYRFTGAGGWLDGLPFGGSLPGLMLTGACRVGFVVAAYLGLLWIVRSRSRRGRPPTIPRTVGSGGRGNADR